MLRRKHLEQRVTVTKMITDKVMVIREMAIKAIVRMIELVHMVHVDVRVNK